MRTRRLLLAALVVLLPACSDDDGSADTGNSTGSRDAFCGELRTVVQSGLTVFDPLQPAAPDDSAAALDRLADAAPTEIAEPMALLAEEFAAIAELLAEVDPSDPEAAERLDELGIDPAASDAASQAVTDYARDRCGIDLAALNAASASTTTTALGATTTVPGTTPPPPTAPATTVAG